MSTDQADATAAPTAGQAPEPATAALRPVDGFLEALDDVLTTSTAPSIPAPTSDPLPATDPAPTVAPDPGVEAPAAPAPAPKPAERDWWDPLYQHDTADLDTFTGNLPKPATKASEAPPRPAYAPDVQDDATDDEDQEQPAAPTTDDDGDEEPQPKWGGRWRLRKADQDDDEVETPARTTTEAGASPTQDSTHGAARAKRLGRARAEASFGFLHPTRGPKLLFAASAYGMGRGLHLDDRVTALMADAHQYALPITGCAFAGGVLCLSTGTKGGAVIFIGSLGLIGTLTLADPARVVGGAVALGCFTAYRLFRRWIGRYGDQWPWKGVAWAAFVPTATSTVAFLLYGTN
ncbi:hypothetical protein [Streptomyces sp. NBC_00470]|uniref:hypothetical protein n=1 Tax=Streptomyces sp. NBC_00470 TaxID=2975753 RepID=UPI002F90E650